jgi:hypothetical protein
MKSFPEAQTQTRTQTDAQKPNPTENLPRNRDSPYVNARTVRESQPGKEKMQVFEKGV